MIRLRCLALLLLALPAAASAQQSGLAFLRVGNDAALSAMGDVQATAGGGAFAAVHNPAGLAAPGPNALGVAYRAWIAGEQTYALGARFRAGRHGGFGLALVATRNEGFEAREQPGDPAGTFDVQFTGVTAAYARAFGPLRVGLGAKYLSERLYTDGATGYAFDAGLQADLLDASVQLGAAVQHLGRMSELGQAATPLPRTVRGGLAVRPLRVLAATDGAAVANVTVVGEVAYRIPDEALQVHAGLAAEVLDLVTLRAGYVTNDALRSVTFGGGLAQGAFAFDYGFIPFTDGFGGPGHVLTLRYGW